MGKASVNSQKNRLYLLAKLPRKDGKGPNEAQRIPTGLSDTAVNRRVAEKRRARLQRAIDTDTFEWADWVETNKGGATWKQAIAQLYKKRVILGRTGENTWEQNYMGRLRQADMNKVVTSREIERFMNRWRVDQCSYKEAFYLIKDMCTLIAVPFPEIPLPKYKESALANVPEDHEIIEWVEKIQAVDPELAWCVGMMATYGLRDHELDDCWFIDLKNRLGVPDETKTGYRTVVPLERDWVDLFELRSERRRVKVSKAPDSTAQWLFYHRKKVGFPYKPYALRHSYAWRLWHVGGAKLDIFTAARLMGHSVEVHERTYRKWIQPHTIAVRAEEALGFGPAVEALTLQE